MSPGCPDTLRCEADDFPVDVLLRKGLTGAGEGLVFTGDAATADVADAGAVACGLLSVAGIAGEVVTVRVRFFQSRCPHRCCSASKRFSERVHWSLADQEAIRVRSAGVAAFSWRNCQPAGSSCFTQSLTVRLRVRGSAVTGALPGVPVMMIFDRAASAVSAGAGRGRDCAVTACAEVFVTETGRLTGGGLSRRCVCARIELLSLICPSTKTSAVVAFSGSCGGAKPAQPVRSDGRKSVRCFLCIEKAPEERFRVAGRIAGTFRAIGKIG